MNLYSAADMLAEKELVVFEDHANSKLLVARPFSIDGSAFEYWLDEASVVSGMGDVVLKVNAPFAEIYQISKKKWLAIIEYANCGGECDEAWLYKKCSSPKEAAQAIIDCYFQKEMVLLKTIDT